MSAETKRKLLNATRQIISESGMGILSMRSLGSYTNLSRSAVYRYFPDKESLLAEVAAETFQMIQESFQPGGEDAHRTSSRELLQRIFIQFYTFGISEPEHYKLMFSTNWDKSRFPKLEENAFELFQMVLALTCNVLKDGGKSINSARELTAINYAFIHGLIQLHLAGHQEPEKGLNDAESLIATQIDGLLLGRT